MGPKPKAPCKRCRLDSGYSEAPDPELGQDEPAATPLASQPSSDPYPDQDSFYDCESVTLGARSGFRKMAVVVSIYIISLGLAAHIGYEMKSDSDREASFVVQVGGWGDRPTTEVEELYRPATPECKTNQRKVLNLPVPLRAHVAIQVDGFGILVCGGTSRKKQAVPSTGCYVFKHEVGAWEDAHQLNVGRMNAYIMQIDQSIHIIGGSSSIPFKPCLNTEEVLDLTTLEAGWQMRETAHSLCSQRDEEVVEIACNYFK